MMAKSLKSQICDALRNRSQAALDELGYVATPGANLVDGVAIGHIEDDFRKGYGDELRAKFCAVHSSSALVANTFGFFKTEGKESSFSLLNIAGANTLTFERRFPIFRGGTPPNVDVWVEQNECSIAIESKFTEYLTKKRPRFSTVYERLAPPGIAEACWWDLYRKVKQGDARHLDVAQLIKHYFGLRRHQTRSGCAGAVKLLYLYWEPHMASEIPVCIAHRGEVQQFALDVAESTIEFRAMTYAQLWDEWSRSPDTALRQHVANLKAKYEVSLRIAGCTE